ncbi:MAG: cytochrome P450 [Anaerolineaceae bacterium]|nr:cytochrome P450 [Anaerolineaceae bacterium]
MGTAMTTLSLRHLQRILREQGPAGSISISAEIGASGVGEMRVPFIMRVFYLMKPEDIHALLVQHNDEAGKVELIARIARTTFGNGILFSNGAMWKRQRKLMQPVFHHAHVKAYGERMVNIAKQHIAQWKPNNVLDLANEMHAITLRIVVDTLFSGDATGEIDEIREAIHDIGAGFSAQAQSVFLALMPDWFPAPALRQKNRGAKKFNRILERLIAERRKLGEANSPQDLLTSLMFTKDSDTGETMSNEQLRGELLTLYVAGHETTANLLAWSLHFISKYPEVAQKLLVEVDLLEGKPPTTEDLARLPYSKMILQETLRMRPPVWFMQRQSAVPLTINGRSYPKNAMFFILVYANHHNPAVFTEPNIFRPERWANDAEKNLPKGAYTPFSTGARICIGNGFAMMEAQLLLTLIMQRFQITLLDEAQIPKGTPITLSFAKPVRMQISPINA